MIEPEPTNGEIYRAVLRLERAINGNGQPGIRTELTKLETRFDSHERQHSLGGFTRKQIVAYGGLAVTAVGVVAGLASRVVAHL